VSLSARRTHSSAKRLALHCLGLIVLVIGAVTTLGMAQSALPPPVKMQDLTIPKDRLPEGCALKAIEPAQEDMIAASGAT
jgi:hypothetical protein